jgi:hypothetical protein
VVFILYLEIIAMSGSIIVEEHGAFLDASECVEDMGT